MNSSFPAFLISEHPDSGRHYRGLKSDHAAQDVFTSARPRFYPHRFLPVLYSASNSQLYYTTGY